MRTFEQLPAKTKELELLQLQAEKATGQESVALNAAIREKAKPAAADPPPLGQANADPHSRSQTSEQWKRV